MTVREYQNAVGCFDPDIYMKRRIAARVEREERERRPARRVLRRVLVAAVVLLCTMGIALAASPTARQAVISLFQIDAVEQVPGIPAGTNEVLQVTIGDDVTAQYVRVEGSWLHSITGGELLEQDGFPRCLYALEGETLMEMGTDAPEASVEVDWQGAAYVGRFRWFTYHDQLYTVNMLHSDPGNVSAANWDLCPSTLGDRTDVVLLTGYVIQQLEEAYVWVYDLESGQLIDPLEGCGIEALGPTREVRLSEDMKHALVRAGEDFDGVPYLVDLEAKTCEPLLQLMGLEDGYAAGFVGNDKIRVNCTRTVEEKVDLSCYTYHIPSGAVTQTVDKEQLSWLRYGGDLALSVAEDGTATVVDTGTGGRIQLDGVKADGRYRCVGNEAGTRLFWAEWGEDGISRIGVIDLEEGTFRAFRREGNENLPAESVYWLGNDRVVIESNLRRGEGFDPDRVDEYYLCVYEF